MLRRRPAATAVGAVAGLAALMAGAGCGGDSRSATPTDQPPTSPPETPTQVDRCYPDVTVTPVPEQLEDLPLPDRTKVYVVEERGDNGVIITGVTDQPFRSSASLMRARYREPPFTIVGYDRNATAFGANWTGRSISGRWVLTDITPLCPGDTEVKILWTSAGGQAD